MNEELRFQTFVTTQFAEDPFFLEFTDESYSILRETFRSEVMNGTDMVVFVPLTNGVFINSALRSCSESLSAAYGVSAFRL